MYGADDPWLWRGQTNSSHGLEPAVHTRIRTTGRPLIDAEVQSCTIGLLEVARKAALDQHEGTRLPDLAMLALLQHHGAATPLLDVSLDPMVALYMATVSPNPADDDLDGIVFAIRRPRIVIADFDSRTFNGIYTNLATDEVALYSAPDVSERLRIQRGHFLLGRVNTTSRRVTIPLSLDSGPVAKRWIYKRMKGRGRQGPPAAATTDIAVFRVTARFKKDIRTWLEARTGLTEDFVYPTAWHQPHLDRFASSHGRRAVF